MISNIPTVDRSPEDAESDADRHHSEEYEDDDDDDDDDDDEESNEDESSEDGKEAESSPSYEVPKEPRTKTQHNPSGKAGGASQPTASGQTTRSSKRAHAEAESSAEKSPSSPSRSLRSLGRRRCLGSRWRCL